MVTPTLAIMVGSILCFCWMAVMSLLDYRARQRILEQELQAVKLREAQLLNHVVRLRRFLITQEEQRFKREEKYAKWREMAEPGAQDAVGSLIDLDTITECAQSIKALREERDSLSLEEWLLANDYEHELISKRQHHPKQAKSVWSRFGLH